MGQYFDDIHESWQSQLGSAPVRIDDSEEIGELRKKEDYDSLIQLGQCLARQLRYQEAIAVFDQALAIRPGDQLANRLRAGKCLTVLRCDEAKQGFLKGLQMGGDLLEYAYRLGICCYDQGNYREAEEWLKKGYPLCDDEMGIAVIYWHTLSCLRQGKTPELLSAYRPEMKVGHHTAYRLAVQVCCGEKTLDEAERELDKDKDALTFAIAGYGISVYLESQGQTDRAVSYRQEVIRSDEYWPCLAWLAAFQDNKR